ncbi:CooT family nickel-binding protein [Methanococcus sp. CF]
MCESTVYLDDGTVVMADVMKIVVNGNNLELYDILNNKKEIKAKFNALDLEGHKIIVTEL